MAKDKGNVLMREDFDNHEGFSFYHIASSKSSIDD